MDPLILGIRQNEFILLLFTLFFGVCFIFNELLANFNTPETYSSILNSLRTWVVSKRRKNKKEITIFNNVPETIEEITRNLPDEETGIDLSQFINTWKDKR